MGWIMTLFQSAQQTDGQVSVQTDGTTPLTAWALGTYICMPTNTNCHKGGMYKQGSAFSADKMFLLTKQDIDKQTRKWNAQDRTLLDSAHASKHAR